MPRISLGVLCGLIFGSLDISSHGFLLSFPISERLVYSIHRTLRSGIRDLQNIKLPVSRDGSLDCPSASC